MNKIFTIITLFFVFGLYAQGEVTKKVKTLVTDGVNFKNYTVLNSSTEIPNLETKKVIDKATFAKLNLESLKSLVIEKNEYIQLTIPYLNENIEVQLYRVNLFAEDFHIDTDKANNVAYIPGVYYRGMIKGDDTSIVSFNFFNNELNGIISSKTLNNLVVGKLNKIDNISDYIIYSDSDLKVLNDFKCDTKYTGGIQIPEVSNKSSQNFSLKCVTVYFELQYNLYQANGNNLTATSNWMTSVFNNIQTLYNNDGISSALKNVFIWTTEDPYSGDSSSDYLYQFNDNRCVFDGDLGQLLGIDSGGLGGVAVGTNGLCSQSNFSYSDVNFSYSTVPIYSWTINVIAHELGHLMGSQHTHDCAWNGNNTRIDGCGNNGLGDCPEAEYASDGGTIMSYCHLIFGEINLSNGFGPQPKARILNKINNSGCLGTNCTTTCINTICSITAANVTTNSALLNWNETNVNTNSWKLSVKPFNEVAVFNNVSSNNFTANSLLPNTFYKAKVGKNCGSNLIPSTSETVFLTSANYCNGIVLTDTGGTIGDYEDDQSYVRTIIPNLANRKIKLTFTSFDLETDYDYLYIYNGNSTNAPSFNTTGYTGNENPGTFNSTVSDGSLTIKFYSDGGVVAPGYVANVSCVAPLANEEFLQDIDFTYSPNPTNGLVTITSKTKIIDVFVFNLEGRLLYSNKVNDLDTKIDINSFASGTYFFKLKFEEKEVNFKIIKM